MKGKKVVVDPSDADRFIAGGAAEPAGEAAELEEEPRGGDSGISPLPPRVVKVRKMLYLHPEVAKALEKLARKTGRPETQVAELLLRRGLGLGE